MSTFTPKSRTLNHVHRWLALACASETLTPWPCTQQSAIERCTCPGWHTASQRLEQVTLVERRTSSWLVTVRCTWQGTLQWVSR